MVQHVGGSFAPPITSEVLTQYAALVQSAYDPQVKDAAGRLIEMMKAYLKMPESTSEGKPHSSGLGVEKELAGDVIQALWDHVPWQYEIDAIAKVFEGIPSNTQRALRNAAFHLLWYATELTKDRQPITTDKL